MPKRKGRKQQWHSQGGVVTMDLWRSRLWGIQWGSWQSSLPAECPAPSSRLQPLPVKGTLLESDKRFRRKAVFPGTLCLGVCVTRIYLLQLQKWKAFSGSDWLGPHEPWILWLVIAGQKIPLWKRTIFPIPNVSNSLMIETMTTQDKWCSKQTKTSKPLFIWLF